MKLRFTPLALAEIDRVLARLSDRSASGARNVRNRLRQVTNSVRRYPYIGQLTDAAVRRLVLAPYPYIVFYTVGEAEIVVVGFRHAARDPATMPDAGEV